MVTDGLIKRNQRGRKMEVEKVKMSQAFLDAQIISQETINLIDEIMGILSGMKSKKIHLINMSIYRE